MPGMPDLHLGDSLTQISKDVWAERSGSWITLHHKGDVDATIEKDGTYWIIFHSETVAPHFMTKDEALTDQVQEHWRDYARRTNPKHKEGALTYLENWINEHPYRSWGKPDVFPGGRQGWETAEFESGNTESFGEDCWLGDTFIYVHFHKPGDEGAIIMWHKGGDIRGNYTDPEVWVGDFQGFMNEQTHCEWYDPYGFINWNETFDGGFMWALKEMGSFEEGLELSSVVYKAILEDPRIAFNIGILENERAFPPEVVSAVKKAAEKYGR